VHEPDDKHDGHNDDHDSANHNNGSRDDDHLSTNHDHCGHHDSSAVGVLLLCRDEYMQFVFYGRTECMRRFLPNYKSFI
jgi:hypothetical protein